MANKKGFKGDNPALSFISTPEAHEDHEEHDTQEASVVLDAQEVHDERRTPVSQTTQGKKGMKLPRINMAFATTNLEYLQIMSRIEGVSITEYVNRLIQADKEARKDILEAAKKLLKGIK